MMFHQRKNLRRLCGFVVVCCISGWGIGAVVADTVPATVVMTSGRVLQGELAGLEPTSRLVAEVPPHVGPPGTLDIAVSEIGQITLDFPRLVIETPDRVFIAPWSSIQGIPAELTIDTDQGSFTLVTAAIRAMALHGNTLHTVPREWLGDAFLQMPDVLISSGGEESGDIAPTTPGDSRMEGDETIIDLTSPIFGGTDAADTIAEPADSSPWWILLVVAAIVVVVVIVASGSGGA